MDLSHMSLRLMTVLAYSAIIRSNSSTDRDSTMVSSSLMDLPQSSSPGCASSDLTERITASSTHFLADRMHNKVLMFLSLSIISASERELW